MGDKDVFEPDPDPIETARRLQERVEAIQEKSVERRRRPYRSLDPEDTRLPYKE